MPKAPRRERRERERPLRQLRAAQARLDAVVHLLPEPIPRWPAYAAYKAGLITRKQARLLGVLGDGVPWVAQANVYVVNELGYRASKQPKHAR